MMNISQIDSNFPCIRVEGEMITSRNLLEVIREDGSGYSFNGKIFVGEKERPCYFRFNPASKRIQTLVIDGNQISL